MRVLRLVCQIVGAATLLVIILGIVSMSFASQWLQVNDEPVAADYILPLAGDTYRNLHAADLYAQGYAPTVLVSLAKSSVQADRLVEVQQTLGYPQFATHQDYYHALYDVLNVPRNALEFFGGSHISTVEEAEALRKHLDGKPIHLLLITSPYHARRAKTIFERVYPEAEICMTITPYEPFQPRWWTDQHSAQMVVLETAKIVYSVLGGAYRSTDAPSP